MIEGNGVRLTIDGDTVELREAFVPFLFSGDAFVTCALIDGPVRAFNTMRLRESEVPMPTFTYLPDTGDTLIETSAAQ